MDIYVGNLPFEVTDSELQQLFEKHGQVESARVVTDRDTGRAKGFGFVTMNNKTEAEAAIAAINGTDMGGRALRVNESQPKPRDNRGGGRSGGGKRW
ncbi:MAG: RNA recognition motif domain-containing protein [Kiritimatiellia bacterium]|nr:RNA-binding protein [Lentisphaerota bacterium]